MKINYFLTFLFFSSAFGCAKEAGSNMYQVRIVTFSPDGKYLASGGGFIGNTNSGPPWGGEGELIIWKVPTWEKVFSSRENFTSLVSAIFFLSEEKIGVGSAHYIRNAVGNPWGGLSFRFWDLEKRKEIPSVQIKDYRGSINKMVFSSEKNLLGVASLGTQPAIFNVNKEMNKYYLEDHKTVSKCLDFSPDRKKIVSCASNPPTIRLFDINGKKETFFNLEEAKPYYAKFSPDGKTLWVTCDNGFLYVVNYSNGKQIKKIPIGTNVRPIFTFSPNGEKIALISGWAVEIINTQTGKKEKTHENKFGQVNSVSFSPDGSLLAIGYGKYNLKNPNMKGWGAIQVLDIKNGTVCYEYK